MKKKKIHKVARINIYIFGILANTIPIVGLLLLREWDPMHQFQAVAWSFGSIYYVFMYAVAIIAWKKLTKQNQQMQQDFVASKQANIELKKQIDDLAQKIKILEETLE